MGEGPQRPPDGGGDSVPDGPEKAPTTVCKEEEEEKGKKEEIQGGRRWVELTSALRKVGGKMKKNQLKARQADKRTARRVKAFDNSSASIYC